MPISAKAQLEKRRTISIDIDGESLSVTYRPYTPAEHSGLIEEMMEDGSGGDLTIARRLADILLAWDMETAPDDPTPYPTDVAHLEALPSELVKAIWQGINNQNRQVPKLSKLISGGGSPQAGSLVPSPNGT
jgi:hypothetical protein